MGLGVGPLHVRRSAFIAAAPERVWQEFETRERLAAWFGIGHTLERFEPRVGGEVRFFVEVDGVKRSFGGRCLVFEPGRELSYESNWLDDRAWPVPLFHTIRLAPIHSGSGVEVLHHGFERLGADAGAELESYEQGWDNHHLIALRAIVERP